MRTRTRTAFDLKFEKSVTYGRETSSEAMSEVFFTSYGPTKMLLGSLDPDRRAQLRRAFTDFHAQYTTELGVQVPRDYLLAVGVRK